MKEILVETEDMKVFVQSEGSTQRTEVFPEGTHQRTEVFPESSHQRTEVFPEIEQKIFLEQPSTPTILIHDKVKKQVFRIRIIFVWIWNLRFRIVNNGSGS